MRCPAAYLLMLAWYAAAKAGAPEREACKAAYIEHLQGCAECREMIKREAG